MITMDRNRLKNLMNRAKLNNISIKYSFIIILILIVTPLFLVISDIYYNEIKEGIIDNSKIAVAQSEETILNTIKITEKSYEFISVNYEDMMKECLAEFEEVYEENGRNIDEIDLEAIKNKYNNKMDLYVINQDGIIIFSTLPTALGIDFSTIPEFYTALEKMRLGSTIEISKVTTDLKTRELRKWGYMPTKDHEFILEVGINAAELAKYVKSIDYVAMGANITENNPYIDSVRVYDMHNTALGYDEPVSTDKQAIIQSVMSSGLNKEVNLPGGLIQTEYIFINTFSNSLYDSKKVIEIQYNSSLIMESINQLKMSVVMLFLIYTLTSLAIINYVSNKFIIKPLVFLNSEISKLDENNLLVRATVIGNNEIAELAQTFNYVSERLDESMVSKKYLENVLDSVGDIVILTDEDMKILQINQFGRQVLGNCENGSMEELLKNPEYLAIIKERIKDEKTLIDIEIILRDSLSNDIELLSTWTTLLNDDGSIKGYVCNAKNFAKTKEVIRQLNDINIELHSKKQELLDKSNKDFLTGLYSRSFIVDKFNYLIMNGNVNLEFCALMMDIDYFKMVNDNYGHSVGDEVLIKIAEVIKNNLRITDFASRFGGEEFVIILSDTSHTIGLKIAERIRRDIERTSFTDHNLNITVSGGLAEWKGESLIALIEKADRQLYISKNSGRNQISYSKL